MRRSAPLWAAAIMAVACEEPTRPSNDDVGLLAHGSSRNIVRVAPPTGDPATDAANIAAAVAAATPGATIEFARGTYVLQGPTIVVAVPGVTLQGHRRGTTVRGVFHDNPDDDFFDPYFQLVGGHQTVRRITFRDTHQPLSMGEPGSAVGGYRVEDCTFRENLTPILFFAFSDDVSRIARNHFINVVVPFNIGGKTVHFRDNLIASPDPGATPILGQPFNAGAVFADLVAGICENNVFEDNTIIGNADGFVLFGFEVEVCRHNVIRDNTFIRQRVFTNEDAGSMVVLGGPGVQGNLIEDNELRGSEGLGILVLEASNNRIIDNEFRNLPGQKETPVPFPGTAIFLDELTTGNRVNENEFKRVVNRIVDLGTDNIIQDDDDDHDDHDVIAAPGLGPSVTAERSGRAAYPKLDWLRQRAQR